MSVAIVLVVFITKMRGWHDDSKNKRWSPVNIYLFKVNNRNTRKRCEICSNLTIKTPVDVIDVVLVFLLLTSQLAFTCSKSTIEILEKGVKYVQN